MWGWGLVSPRPDPVQVSAGHPGRDSHSVAWSGSTGEQMQELAEIIETAAAQDGPK